MDDFIQNLPKPTEPDKPNRHIKDWLSTLAVIILAPLLALFLTTFVFQTYEVDGPSMESTLQHQDRLIVLKAPRSWAKITGNEYIPHRYDIIVFNHRGSLAGNDEKQLIKRVIGLPGDRVVVKDDIVKIYNQEHPDGFLVDQNSPEEAAVSTTPGQIDQKIEEGEVFVLGDNRENSLDSPDFGAVSSEDIVGKLALRIYPFDKFQKFD